MSNDQECKPVHMNVQRLVARGLVIASGVFSAIVPGVGALR